MKKRLSTLEIMYANYARATKDRPSALRSTLYFGPMGWVARIVGGILLITGLVLFTAAAVTAPNCTPTEILCGECKGKFNVAFLTQYPAFLGLCLILIGYFMNLCGRLCRRILHRNFYIMELEDIFDKFADEREEEKEVDQKKK